MNDKSSLYGLPCIELTDKQLRRVDTDKLIQCLDSDSRAQGILVGRMLGDLEANELTQYKYVSEDDWNTYAELKAAYNELLNLTDSFAARISNDSYYSTRTRYLFWAGMNDAHRSVEVDRFSKSQGSIVDALNIDYGWLQTYDPNKAKAVMRCVVANGKYYYATRGLQRIIQAAPTDMLLELEPHISRAGRETRLKLLSNPNTPEEWLDGLLRIYANRVVHSCPQVRRALSSVVLSKLPPVMRLEVLERLVRKESRECLIRVLPDVKTADDFKVMLFSLLTRYSDRVIALIDHYNSKMLPPNSGKEQEL